MFCIGLTGTIGSGKSTVAQLFQTLGIDIISADKISRSLTIPGQPALEEIRQHFGADITNKEGELDRRKLRKLIFTNPTERQWLENLLHPLIRQGIEAKINKAKGPYLIIEIPLLLSRENYPYLNRILLVIAEPETQIQRIMTRDKITREQAIKMLDTQPANQLRINLADDLIHNQGSLEELTQQVETLHIKYLTEAEKTHQETNI